MSDYDERTSELDVPAAEAGWSGGPSDDFDEAAYYRERTEHWVRQASAARGEMASLRRYYGVPAKRGGRVRFTWRNWAGSREGTITSAESHKLWIRFDGELRPKGPFHPTWEIEYLDV